MQQLAALERLMTDFFCFVCVRGEKGEVTSSAGSCASKFYATFTQSSHEAHMGNTRMSRGSKNVSLTAHFPVTAGGALQTYLGLVWMSDMGERRKCHLAEDVGKPRVLECNVSDVEINHKLTQWIVWGQQGWSL